MQSKYFNIINNFFFIPLAGKNGAKYSVVLQGTRFAYFGHATRHRETAHILRKLIRWRASEAQLVTWHEHGRLRQTKHSAIIHLRQRKLTVSQIKTKRMITRA